MNKAQNLLLLAEVEGVVDEIVDDVQHFVDEELRLEIERVEDGLALTPFHAEFCCILRSGPRLPLSLHLRALGHHLRKITSGILFKS